MCFGIPFWFVCSHQLTMTFLFASELSMDQTSFSTLPNSRLKCPSDLCFPSHFHEFNLAWLHHQYLSSFRICILLLLLLLFNPSFLILFVDSWLQFFIFELLRVSSITMINQKLTSFFEYSRMLRFLYFSIIWSMVTNDSASCIITEILLSSLLLGPVNFQQVILTLPFHRNGQNGLRSLFFFIIFK